MACQFHSSQFLQVENLFEFDKITKLNSVWSPLESEMILVSIYTCYGSLYPDGDCNTNDAVTGISLY